MTALRPVETHNVVAVASEEYPSNFICAHPECQNLVDLRPSGEPTVHHGFSRSKIKSKSYFVSIDGGKPIPHAVGFCGSGTTKHHGDLEDHRAKLVLNDDGVWEWHDYIGDEGEFDYGGEPGEYNYSGEPGEDTEFVYIGDLNPQPGSSDSKAKKRKKHATTPEERRARVNFTIRTPKGEENLIPELCELVRDRKKLLKSHGWTDTVPVYEIVILGLYELLRDR